MWRTFFQECISGWADFSTEGLPQYTPLGFDVVFSGEDLLKAIEARKMKNSLRAEGKDIPEQGRSRPRIATR
jgi:hypothetical protein